MGGPTTVCWGVLHEADLMAAEGDWASEAQPGMLPLLAKCDCPDACQWKQHLVADWLGKAMVV